MDHLIIFLLLLFGLASAQFLPNGCPEDFSVHLLLPHESECNRFYSCSNGQTILMQCSPGTLFDASIQGCNHAHAVVCQTTELPESTSESAETTTLNILTTKPNITTTTPSVLTTPANITTTTPSVSTASPNITITTPNVSTISPNITTTTPSVSTLSPNITITTPSVSTLSPNITITTPNVSTISPNITTTTPSVSTLSPNITITTPNVSTISPNITTTTPSVSTLSPNITITTTSVSTISPNITTTTPSVSTTPANISTTTPAILTTLSNITITTPSVSTISPNITTTTPNVSTTPANISTTTPAISTTLPNITITTPSVSTISPNITTTTPSVSTTPANILTTTPAISTTLPNITITTPSVSTISPNITTTTPSVSTTPANISTTTPAISTTLPNITITTPSVSTISPNITTTTPSVSTIPANISTTSPTISTTNNVEEYFPSRCPSDFNVHLLLPHESDCDKFYSCSNGRKILMHCPSTLLFDLKSQHCNWPHSVDCNISTTTLATTEANDNNTTAFTTTSSSEPGTITTAQLTTDSKLTTTDQPTVEHQITTLGPVTTDQEATTYFPSTASICPDDFFGVIPHPELCDSYYTCTGWSPIQLFCRKGYEFDSKLEKCVEIAIGGCTWSQNPTTNETTIEATTENTALTESTTVIPDVTADQQTTDEITTENSFIDETTQEVTTNNTTTIKPLNSTTVTAEHTKTSSEFTTEASTSRKTTTDLDTETTHFPTTSPVSNAPTTTSTLRTEEPTILPESTIAQTTSDEWNIITEEETLAIDGSTTSVFTTSKSPIVTTTEIDLSSICPDGFFGNVPHPFICDAYYLCSGWSPILLYCPSGQEFDPQLGSCADFLEGGCTWLQISPTSTTEISTSDFSLQNTESLPTTNIEFTTLYTNEPEEISKITTTESDYTVEITTESLTEITISHSNEPDIISETTITDIHTTTRDTTYLPTTTDRAVVTEDVTSDFSTKKLTTLDSSTLATTTENWGSTLDQENSESLEVTSEHDTTQTATEGTTVKPDPVIVCPDGFFGNLPHPNRCDAYYLCSGWNPILLFCPSGHEFIPESSACAVITEGGCTWQQTSPASTTENTIKTSTSDSSTPQNTESLPTTTVEYTTSDTNEPEEISHTTNTEIYTTRDTTYLPTTIEVSTDGTVVTEDVSFFSTERLDLSTFSTTIENWGSTTDQEGSETLEVTSDHNSTQTATEGTTVKPQPVIVCPDGFFGNLPHPDRCDAYFLCSGWNPILLFCPSGQEFVPESSACAVITEGGCNWQQTSSSSTTENTINISTSDLSTPQNTESLPTTTVEYTTSDTNEPEEISHTTNTEIYTTGDTTYLPTTIEVSTDGTVVTEDVSFFSTERLDLSTFSTTIENWGSTTDQEGSETLEVTSDHNSTQTATEGTTVKPQLVIVCPNGFFGNLPHPDRCDAYFLCSGWNPILLLCPSGQEFVPESSACAVITEGGCNWQQTSSSSTTENTINISTSDLSTPQNTESLPTTTVKYTTSDTNEPEEISHTTNTEIYTTEDTTYLPTTIEVSTDGTVVTEDVSYFSTERLDLSTLAPTIENWGSTTDQEGTETLEVTSDHNSTQTATESTTVKPEPVIVCPDGFFGNMPHPDRCDAYFLCSGWNPILLFCPSGYEFVPEFGICAIITEGGCTWQPTSPTSTTENGTLQTTESLITTTAEFTTSNSNVSVTISETTITETQTNTKDTTYLPTSTEVSTVVTEYVTTEFSTEKSTTTDSSTLALTTENWGSTSGQEGSETLKVTSEHDTTQTATESTTIKLEPVIVCPDGFFGNLPHPDRCDAYFLCSGWNPILLFCPSGHEFNLGLGTCVVIAEGGCNWHKTSTTSITGQTITYTLPDISTDAVTEELSTTFDAITEKGSTTGSWETTTDSKSTDETTTEAVTTLEPTTLEVTAYSTTNNFPTLIESQTTPESTNESETSTTKENTTEKLSTDLPTTVRDTQTIVTEDQETAETLELSTEHDTTQTTTESTSVNPEAVIVCPDGYFGNLPHPERCDAYFLCSGWNPILLFCPTGHEFYPELGTCVVIAESGCTWNKTTTTSIAYTSPDISTDAVTEKSTTPDIITENRSTTVTWQTTTSSKSTDEQTTFETTTEELFTPEPTTLEVTEYSTTENLPTSTGSQPTPESTNESETSTPMIEITVEATTKILLTDSPTTNETVVTKEQETTETLEVTSEHDTTQTTAKSLTENPEAVIVCPDGYFGNLPHPERCDAYFLCSGWNPIFLFCPTGREFDPTSGTCVLIAEGGCTWLQSSTPSVTEQTTANTSPYVSTDIVTEDVSTADANTNGIDFTTLSFQPTLEQITVNLSTLEPTTLKVIEMTTYNTDVTTEEGMKTESQTIKESTTIFEPSTTQSDLGNTELTTLESTTEANEATTPEICPSGFFGSVANVKECDAYYMCTGWMPIPLRCSKGFEFDPSAQACVKIAEGGCTWDSTSTVQPSTEASSLHFTTTETTTYDNQETMTMKQEITTRVQETTTIANITSNINQNSTTIGEEISKETTNDKPYTTVTEVIFEIADTTVTATTLDDNAFLPPNPGLPVAPTVEPFPNVTTTPEAAEREQTTLDLVSTILETTTELVDVTEELEASTPALCPDGFFGSVSHPEKCDTYYMCSGWMPILLRCSSGFEFNPITQSCVAIADGGCTFNKSSRRL